MIIKEISIMVFDEDIKPGDVFLMKDRNHLPINIMVVKIPLDRRSLEYVFIENASSQCPEAKIKTLIADDVEAGRIKLKKMEAI